MAIPRETINLIRERAQIEEIAKRYVPSLKKRGNNHVGLCPFHKDSNPSFTVSPEKRIFYCFGCHEGGNIFTFISKVEGLNFPESVRFVADIVGISIDEKDYRRPSDYNKFFELNRLASNLYADSIRSNTGKIAQQYLSKRGVKDESIDNFKLGYSPDSWNFLTRHLKDKNIPLNQAVGIGLLSASEKNGEKHYYDRFRDRIIFPIITPKGDIIAFGGRVIGNGEPKYLNSPDSEIFRKRTVLYGFNIAKGYISDLKRAIIVEGYLDVIGCHQEGINNVVAPLGTALTREQVELLSRFCNEIVLVFDADSAGIKASLRSLDILQDKNIDVKIAELPEDDPFGFIKEKGIREFMAIVDSAVKPVEFKIQQIVYEHGKTNKLNTLLKLFEVIKELNSETERSIYLTRISTILGINQNAVRSDFKGFLRKREKSESYEVKIGNEREKIDSLKRVYGYRDLVGLLCKYPQLIEKAALDFSEDEIDDHLAKNIFSKLIEIYSAGEEINIDKMFDFFSEGEEKIFLEKCLSHSNKIDNPDEAYTEIYINMRLHQINYKIDKFADSIKRSKTDNGVNVKEYLLEIEVLRREKEKLISYVNDKNSIKLK